MTAPPQVVYVFLFKLCEGLATGLWCTVVCGVYVYTLRGGDGIGVQSVGTIMAIQGLMCVLSTLPVGWLSYLAQRRDSTLRLLALLQFIAIALTSMVMLHDEWSSQLKFKLMCGALALWGVVNGNSPMVDSMLAGSVSAATETKLYTRLHICHVIAQCLGPVCAGAVFYCTEDDWDLVIMQQVILLGMMVALVPTAILLFLDDGGGDEEARARKQSFGRRSRAAHAAGHQQRLAVRDEPSMARPLLAGGDVEQGPPHASDASEAGYNRSMNDEQNLDGFDNLSDRSIGTRASAGPSSLEVSPARPEPVAATASPSNPDCPSPPEPLSGRNSGIPRSPFLLSPEDSAASLDPGPTTHVSSHALEIADVLSDTSAASGTPSSTAARRVSVTNQILTMAPLDEDNAVLDDALFMRTSNSGGALPGMHNSNSGGTPPGMRSSGSGVNLLSVRSSNSGTSQPGARSSRSGALRSRASGDGSMGGGLSHGNSLNSLEEGRVGEPSFRVEASFRGMLTHRDCPIHGHGSQSRSPGSSGTPDECTCWQAVSERLMRPALKLESFKLKPLLGPNQDLPSPNLDSKAQDPPWVRWGKSNSFGRSPFARSSSLGRSDIGGGPGTSGQGAEQQQQQADQVQDRGQAGSTSQLQAGLGFSSQRTASCELPTAPPELPETLSRSRSSPMKGPRSPRNRSTAAAAVAAGSRAGAGAGDSPRVGGGAGGLGSRRKARRLSREGGWDPDADDNRGCCADCTYGVKWVPGIIVLTDLLLGLASGMMVKFIPVFFVTEAGMSPALLCTLYGLVPLTVSATAFVARHVSRLLGRVLTLLVNRTMGILLLLAIAYYPELWTVHTIIVPLALGRSCMMNCNYALERSILADYTPKADRQWWARLETVASLGWSAATLVGGWIISKHGFQVSFYITGAVQLLGLAVNALLLPIIPRKELSLEELVFLLAKTKVITGPRPRG